MIVGLVRTALLWTHLALFAVHSLLGRLFVRDRAKRLRFTARIMSQHSRICIRYLGFHVEVKGAEHIPSDRRVLLVGNHTGYLDILLVASVFPTLFVTSTDMQKTFFMGFMADVAGSIFVDRQNRSRLLAEIAEIRETIESGSPVVVFPEGTSSNGEALLPFKASLFEVAVGTGFSVSPMCLRYRRIGGKPVTPANRDRLYYYGGARFFPHILGVPFLGTVDAAIEFLPGIGCKEGQSRKEVAAECQKAIEEACRSAQG